ncbi:MAG: DUF1553 domain-containing protein [Planctomycetaceae bacterium]
MTDPKNELLTLVNLHLEDRLNVQQQQRVAELLQSDPALVRVYTEYLCLHAQLFWDAGLSSSVCLPDSAPLTGDRRQETRNIPVAAQKQKTPTSSDRSGWSDQSKPVRFVSRRIAMAASLVALVSVWVLLTQTSDHDPQVVDILQNAPVENAAVEQPSSDSDSMSGDSSVAALSNELSASPSAGDTDLKPLELRHAPVVADSADDHAVPATSETAASTNRFTWPKDFTDDMVIAKIDEQLRASWEDQKVGHSPPASDAEWVRRVYLTFAGRIPTLAETESFLADNGPRKRNALLNQVANDPQEASHLAVVWTNLLVGRTVRTGVNREKLFDFLFDQFNRNAPWIDTVNELITAEGRNDENGATNFLLAHLNNEATPATAVTARLFLGEQISCVQCHDHPFAKGVQQQHYWGLNAFFKDTDRVTVAMANAGGEQRMTDVPWKLVDRPQKDRMTYYETRSGLKKAVLPTYDGRTLSPDSQDNRRQQLARLLAADSESRVARAMVNRMWNHFFGYAFTNPVDDMGPHAAVSHPELLNALTQAFVQSDYNVRRLMKWIAGSEAWQLSSEVTDANAVDDPSAGETPLFSRVYVRRMTPEQVYESIRVAIRSAAGQPIEHGKVHSQHRREWVRQFTQAYNTDENDESLDFEGTISQALVMMNSDEVNTAIRQAAESILQRPEIRSASGIDALNLVALAMVNREPTSEEEAAFRQRTRDLRRHQPATAVITAVEDMMWAYLNSSEFVLVN